MIVKFKYSTEPEATFAEKSKVVFQGKFNESKHESLKNSVIELSDNITVFGKDFAWFLDGLNSLAGQIDFIIYLKTIFYAKGFFRLEQVEIDKDKRILKIKPIVSNITDAVKGWDKERKGDSFASEIVNPFIGAVEIAETGRINDNLSLNEPAPPAGLGWGRVSVRYESGSRGNEPITRVYVKWARQVSVSRFDSTWVFDLLNGKYVAPITTGANLLSIAGARKLKDVVQSLLNNIETETNIRLSLKSNFFQWNESLQNVFNEAYAFASEFLTNVMLVQNSDAKRPGSYVRASGDTWKINLDKLKNDLKILFNADCRIEKDRAGLVFRVEHCSFFETFPNNSLISKHTQNIVFSKIVKQKRIDVHRLEKFQYSEGIYTTAFKPAVIENNGVYLTGEKTSKLELLSCDIGSFQDVSNIDKLDDNGFVILATKVIAGQTCLLYENKPMSFSVLIEKLHKWNRIAKSGKINDIATAFHQKTMLSTTDITVRGLQGYEIGEQIQTDWGVFEVNSKEIDIEKGFQTLKFD
jgi:hypothetical protein